MSQKCYLRAPLVNSVCQPLTTIEVFRLSTAAKCLEDSCVSFNGFICVIPTVTNETPSQTLHDK